MPSMMSKWSKRAGGASSDLVAARSGFVRELRRWKVSGEMGEAISSQTR